MSLSIPKTPIFSHRLVNALIDLVSEKKRENDIRERELELEKIRVEYEQWGTIRVKEVIREI